MLLSSKHLNLGSQSKVKIALIVKLDSYEEISKNKGKRNECDISYDQDIKCV